MSYALTPRAVVAMATSIAAPSQSSSSLASWIDIPPDSDFSLQNIPFGVCSFGSNGNDNTQRKKCVTAIGNKIVDLQLLQDAGVFSDIPNLSGTTFSQSTLNKYLQHDPSVWKLVRKRIQDLFRKENGIDTLRSNLTLQKAALHDMPNSDNDGEKTSSSNSVVMHLPVTIGDYTDFYSSREHATNVGTMFRGKDDALQPNWLYLPVGYHGRSSTVIVSGEPVRRPHGQIQVDPNDATKGSSYGPCKLLDFELEVAFFVGGPSNPRGIPLTLEQAKERIFGFCLMNDWSARDIQKWEYVPLGPFTSKNFATTISPWIVPAAALEPFACPTSAIEQVNPVPHEYLRDPTYSSYDMTLTVTIESSLSSSSTLSETTTNPTGGKPQRKKSNQPVCVSNFKHLYWNAAQQLVHHSVTGCVMKPGDLLGSGTISGTSDTAFGSMLELSWKGSRTVPIHNDDGETRKFLQDGDTVIMKGWCGTNDGPHGRIGFGECIGQVLPALKASNTRDDDDTVMDSCTSSSQRYAEVKLYSYWGSSSAWRVRIALNAKGIPHTIIPVNLSNDENWSEEFLQINPMHQVPVLTYKDNGRDEDDPVHVLTQSVAMIEFIDEVLAPDGPMLIPRHDPMLKIAAREMVDLIVSGIQPFQSGSVLWNLEEASEGKIIGAKYANAAITKGLTALQVMMDRNKTRLNQIQPGAADAVGPYCLGNFSPTIVDICLVPQLYNARKYGVDVEADFPVLAAIDKLCSEHPWFAPAHASVHEKLESKET